MMLTTKLVGLALLATAIGHHSATASSAEMDAPPQPTSHKLLLLVLDGIDTIANISEIKNVTNLDAANAEANEHSAGVRACTSSCGHGYGHAAGHKDTRRARRPACPTCGARAPWPRR